MGYESSIMRAPAKPVRTDHIGRLSDNPPEQAEEFCRHRKRTDGGERTGCLTMASNRCHTSNKHSAHLAQSFRLIPSFYVVFNLCYCDDSLAVGSYKRKPIPSRPKQLNDKQQPRRTTYGAINAKAAAAAAGSILSGFDAAKCRQSRYLFISYSNLRDPCTTISSIPLSSAWELPIHAGCESQLS